MATHLRSTKTALGLRMLGAKRSFGHREPSRATREGRPQHGADQAPRALTCHVPVTVDSCVSEEWAVNVLEAVWSLWWIGARHDTHELNWISHVVQNRVTGS